MTEFPLDTDNNVRLTNGDLHINTRREDIQQRLRQRLLFIFGEWFRDPIDGVDYQGKLLVRDSRNSFADREIRKNVMKVDGITSISNITITRDYDEQAKSITVKYRDDVDTEEQELTTSI